MNHSLGCRNKISVMKEEFFLGIPLEFVGNGVLLGETGMEITDESGC